MCIRDSTYSDLFLGETYDATREIIGWNRSGYPAEGWQNVQIADIKKDNLTAQYGAPVKCIDEISPVDIIHTPKGETVIDFGQIIAGKMCIRDRYTTGVEFIVYPHFAFLLF